MGRRITGSRIIQNFKSQKKGFNGTWKSRKLVRTDLKKTLDKSTEQNKPQKIYASMEYTKVENPRKDLGTAHN